MPAGDKAWPDDEPRISICAKLVLGRVKPPRTRSSVLKMNTTRRPSSLNSGSVLTSFPCSPFEETLTRVVLWAKAEVESATHATEASVQSRSRMARAILELVLFSEK